MQKWNLILLSLCMCFFPTLVLAIGYVVAFTISEWEINFLPFIAVPFGLLFSLLIYKDNRFLLIE